MTVQFRIEALAPEHDRAGFVCGSDALDTYLREQASQDIRRRTSACYVAIDTKSDAIAGYYTLAAGSVPLMDLSETMAKKLPRYPLVPVARIGRLAVSVAFFDAKDETAAAFYEHHGFTAFSSNPLTFVLPIATLAKKN